MAEPKKTIPAEVAAVLAQERVATAYKRVFGRDAGSRTEDQRIVWEDLQRAGYIRSPVFLSGKDGNLCPLRAAYADGRRSIVLYAENNVNHTLALQMPEEPKK